MELGFTSGQVTKQREPETPFRILVMGDFSGRENRGICEPDTIAQRPLIPVDIDRFDTVLDTLAPRIRITSSNPDEPDMEFEFRDMEHFHPDHLYREQNLFQVLRQTHARLSDPRTFAETAHELTVGLSGQPESEHPIIPQQAVASPDNEHDSFASLVEGSMKPSRSKNNAPDLSGLINKIVAPYIQPDSDPRQSELLDSVEQATGEQLRKLLHHPRFQSMEATWRNLYNLVTNVETGDELSIHLLDISKAELMQETASSAGNLEASAVYRLLVENGVRTSGGQPWALIVGDYTFGAETTDARLLAFLGAIGSQAGAPFFAAASPELVGCDSLDEYPDARDWKPPEPNPAWDALRKSPFGTWVGLALPRLLLRLPYGEKTDPIDSFDFEEMYGKYEHDDFLWGTPGYACAMLMARAFSQNGWAMTPDDVRDIDDLPWFTCVKDGELTAQACAEIFINDRTAATILDHGLVPIVSNRQYNVARVIRFQSLAVPATGLAGPWA